MTMLPEGTGGPPKPKLTALRVLIWVVVAAIGLFLVISGIVGIITKGS